MTMRRSGEPQIHRGRTRGLGRYGRPTYTQAARIIAKFGGEARFAAAVGIDRVSAYKWSYARPYGADGLIPSTAVELVQRAARVEGILLTPEDWLPTRANYPAPEDETACVDSDNADSDPQDESTEAIA